MRISHLNDVDKRALMLADNKIAMSAGWDLEILAGELADLSSTELAFDIELTGFEIGEIDLIIGDAGDSNPDNVEIAQITKPQRETLARHGAQQAARRWILQAFRPEVFRNYPWK